MAVFGRSYPIHRPIASRLGAPLETPVGFTSATAQVASGTGTAHDASVSIAVNPTVASGSGTASNPSIIKGRIVWPDTPTATGTAHDAVVYIVMGADAAEGVGGAGLSIPTSPAGAAAGVGGAGEVTIYTRAKWRCPERACSRVPVA